MAGTKFITCLVCFEKSRRRPGWWCRHCGHMEPIGIKAEDITPIPRQAVVYEKPKPIESKAKPMTKTMAKELRRLEHEQLAVDIAKLDRSKLPALNLRLKAGLRRE